MLQNWQSMFFILFMILSIHCTSQDSLLTLNRVREEIDFEKMRAQRTNPEHEKDFEVCIRAKNNAWVISKVTRGKELHMVLEKANETLLYATETVEKFSNR